PDLSIGPTACRVELPRSLLEGPRMAQEAAPQPRGSHGAFEARRRLPGAFLAAWKGTSSTTRRTIEATCANMIRRANLSCPLVPLHAKTNAYNKHLEHLLRNRLYSVRARKWFLVSDLQVRTAKPSD